MSIRFGCAAFLTVALLAGQCFLAMAQTPTPACSPAVIWPPFVASESTRLVKPGDSFTLTFTTGVCSAGECVECRSYSDYELTYDSTILRRTDATYVPGTSLGQIGFGVTKTFAFSALKAGATAVRMESRIPNYSAAQTNVTVAVPTVTPSPTNLPSPTGVAEGVAIDADATPGPASNSYGVYGTEADNRFSTQAFGIGDVDGDGYDDWMASRTKRVSGLVKEEDQAIIWGAPDEAGRFPLSVNNLPPERGIVLTGKIPPTGAYYSWIAFGDLDGDGCDEMLMTRHTSTNKAYERATIVFGAPRARWLADGPIDIDAFPADRSLVLHRATTNTQYYERLQLAGDVDGDGYGDLLYENCNFIANELGSRGRVWLYRGGPWLHSRGTIDLDSIPARMITKFQGLGTGTHLPPAQPGDVDGDGFADILLDGNGSMMGTSYPYASLSAFVFYGGINVWPADGLMYESDYDAARISEFGAPSSGAGFTASAAGDMNGDGFADLVFYSPQSAPPGWWQPGKPGEAIVVYGARTLPRRTDLTWVSTPRGERLVGPYAGSYTGWLCHSVGDVNADGFDDLVVRAGEAPGTRNEAIWLVYGSASPRGDRGILNLATITPSQGRLIRQAADLNFDALRLGDVNGDGVSDLGISQYFGSFDWDGSGKVVQYGGRLTALLSTVRRTMPTTHKGHAMPRNAPVVPVGCLVGLEGYPQSGAALGFADGHGPSGALFPSTHQVLEVPAPTPIAQLGALPVGEWQITTDRLDWTTVTLRLAVHPAQLVPVEQGSLRLYRPASTGPGWEELAGPSDATGRHFSADTDRLGSFVIAGQARTVITPTAVPSPVAPTQSPSPTITPTPTPTDSGTTATPTASPTPWIYPTMPPGSCTPSISYSGSARFGSPPPSETNVGDFFTIELVAGGCAYTDSCTYCAIAPFSVECDPDLLSYSGGGSSTPYATLYFYPLAGGETTVTINFGGYNTRIPALSFPLKINGPPLRTPIPPTVDSFPLQSVGDSVPGLSLSIPDLPNRPSVGRAGDVDGDGFDDLFVSFLGKLRLLRGRAASGIVPYSASGSSELPELTDSQEMLNAAGGGDADGDGAADVLIGGTSRAWLLTGARARFTAEAVQSLALGASAQVGEYRLPQERWSHLPVAWQGDLNRDGRTDFSLGNYTTFLLRGGSPSTMPSNPLTLTYTTLPLGVSWWTRGLTIYGAGDFDGDGRTDLICMDGYNFVYVLPGGSISSGATSVWLYDSDNSLRDLSIRSVGDTNGDGRADIVVGDPEFDLPDFADAGRVELVFGSSLFRQGAPSVYLNHLVLPNAVRFAGRTRRLGTGRLVAPVGDFSGDGLADFLVTTDKQEAYVIFGQRSWETTGTLHLASLDDKEIFPLAGAGIADAGPAGDFNGDGIGDLFLVSHLPDRIWVLYSGSPSMAVRRRSLLPAGAVPADWVGDEFGDLMIGFADGTNPPGATASEVSGDFYRTPPRSIPGLEPRTILLSTNRTGWTGATLVFHDVQQPADGGVPHVLFALNHQDTWQSLPAVWDSVGRTLTVQVTQLGYFAIGTMESLPASWPSGITIY